MDCIQNLPLESDKPEAAAIYLKRSGVECVCKHPDE